MKRMTIDFDDTMLRRIQQHARRRGCRSLSETIRDIIRLALYPPFKGRGKVRKHTANQVQEADYGGEGATRDI